MIYIGIDNGVSGALVAISDHPGVAPIEMTMMPVIKTDKGPKVSVRELWAWLSQWRPSDLCAILETPGKHTPGVNALCSMWECYGAIWSLLNSRYIEYRTVYPQEWHAEMIPKCPKGQTEERALLAAKEIWPEEKWMRTPKCKKADHNLVDAALLAEFGRRTA